MFINWRDNAIFWGAGVLTRDPGVAQPHGSVNLEGGATSAGIDCRDPAPY